MHEVDMTKALILTIKDWWLATEQPRIERVHLVIGAFSGVEPVSLQFAFESQKRGTCLDQAELVIRESPFIAYCAPCQQEYRPHMGTRYGCPTCHTPLQDIRSGRELKIDHLEYTHPGVVHA